MPAEHLRPTPKRATPLKQRGMTLHLPEHLWDTMTKEATSQGLTINQLIEHTLIQSYDDPPHEGD